MRAAVNVAEVVTIVTPAGTEASALPMAPVSGAMASAPSMRCDSWWADGVRLSVPWAAVAKSVTAAVAADPRPSAERAVLAVLPPVPPLAIGSVVMAGSFPASIVSWAVLVR